MSETELKKEITDFLKANGYKVYRMQAGYIKKNVQLCPPGTPDLLAVGPRFTVWIEVKLPGKDLRPEQVRHIADLKGMNQRVLVAHSVFEVQEYLGYERKTGVKNQ